MFTYKKPESLNGHQLKKELNDAGIEIENGSIGVEYGQLVFIITKGDEKIALEIVKNHKGIEGWNPNAVAKAALLDRLGLTAEEAELLLA
jgi:hypothetical protein